MKKPYNISTYAKQALGCIFMGILLFACQEDEIVRSTDVEEGIPVKVSFNLSVPEMKTVLTRGLSDSEEFQINDLYLLIFDARGIRKEGTRYYGPDELAPDNNGNQATPTTGSIQNIETTSGVSYIFAAANTASNQLNGGENIKAQLDGVTTLDEFKQVTATLNSKKNAALTDRTQAALVMCGAYIPKTPGEAGDEAGKCIIPRQGGRLDGTLSLERLDSRITFKLSWGGKDSKVTSFELTGWRVCNVPIKSYLLASGQDAVTSKGEDYSKSILENKVTIDEAGKTCSFDFYMLENRKDKQMYDGRYLTNYAEREAEVKENNLNTGTYKYVEPNATYVEIKANMELISSSGSTTGKKVASVTYTIHLGGGNNDFENFRSERNKKYTYNVEINDTENIRVEVQEGKEDRPGVEGSVVDATAKVFNLDAHYNCFIMGFSKKEAKELKFIVKTPFAVIGSDASEAERGSGDYQWIRFARSNDSSTLAEYPADGVGLIDLFGLSADITSQSGTDEDEKFYYTVFVDEYYYDRPPAGKNWQQPYWPYFVNKENREVVFTMSPAYSADKESSYADAQYMIAQRSIQTYYSTTYFNTQKAALGMEHINETGAPDRNEDNSGAAINPSNGFSNTYGYIKKSGEQWENHAYMTQPNEGGYTFTLKSRNGWEACLSRNRDENHNGIIDPEELKWYLPTRDQLLGMVLGAESLVTPLFDADAHPIGSKVTSGDVQYHYLLSNGAKLWAEEGTSVGGIKTGYPQQLRCVRNLNLDMNKDNALDISRKVDNAFQYNEETHVFTMAQLDEKNIRGKVTSGELGLHHNFSSTNRPYLAFQMAKNFHTAAKGTGQWAAFVDTDKLHRSNCKSYYEKEDKSDKGKWRTPNQKEFMIMYTQDMNFVQKRKNKDELEFRAYSRTAWKYDSDRHFGINTNILFLDSGQSNPVALRCVRDVDVDANGNIIEDN